MDSLSDYIEDYQQWVKEFRTPALYQDYLLDKMFIEEVMQTEEGKAIWERLTHEPMFLGS